jgi:hypothetical protein
MRSSAINRRGRQVSEPAPRRICRTAQECFQAGWDDGANDPPLTPAQVTRLAALLGPSIRQAVAQRETAA